MSITEDSTEALRRDMARHNLVPLWELESEIMGLAPRPRSRPWLWRWSDLYDVAERSGSLVPIERGGDRRAIALANPGQDGMPYASSTMWAAIQWLNGKEVAPAHRHTSQAVRFIIDGAGSYSTVEGDRVFLERGDLVMTPPWTWHDHGSESDERAIWLDILDIPFNNFLDASFFEALPEDEQKVTQKVNESVLKYGAGNLQPSWEERSVKYPPMSTYRWRETEQALVDLATVDADPFDDVALEFVNPHSGRPVMSSFTCLIQMLRPGVRGRAHRHTGTVIYLAFEGSGTTVIDGVAFPWSAGDVFVVPSWAVHEHLNPDSSDRAILFSANDTPILRSFDKFRCEEFTENGGHQRVTSTFS